MTDLIVSYLAENDPTKISEIWKQPRDFVYQCYYIQRVKDLNSMLQHLGFMEYMEREKRKRK